MLVQTGTEQKTSRRSEGCVCSLRPRTGVRLQAREPAPWEPSGDWGQQLQPLVPGVGAWWCFLSGTRWAQEELCPMGDEATELRCPGSSRGQGRAERRV